MSEEILGFALSTLLAGVVMALISVCAWFMIKMFRDL